MQHGKFQASLSYVVNPTPKEKKKKMRNNSRTAE